MQAEARREFLVRAAVLWPGAAPEVIQALALLHDQRYYSELVKEAVKQAVLELYGADCYVEVGQRAEKILGQWNVKPIK